MKLQQFLWVIDWYLIIGYWIYIQIIFFYYLIDNLINWQLINNELLIKKLINLSNLAFYKVFPRLN